MTEPTSTTSSSRPSAPCPHCGGATNAGATYCVHCARRVLGYEHCTECREPIAAEARYCPFCAQRVRRGRRSAVDVTPHALELTVHSTRWGSLLGARSLAGFVSPTRLRMSAEAIRVRQSVAFGLRKHERRLALDDIATADYTQGALWSEIVIIMDNDGEEIRVGGLRHRDAKAILFELR